MTDTELLARLYAYGADESGIHDRFSGNVVLYAECFRDFLREENITALRSSMEKGAYEKAFAPAHALKGLAGNLGLTAYYQAICDLVEVLRGKDYAAAPDLYAKTEALLDDLRSIAAEPGPAPAPSGDAPSPPANEEKTPPAEYPADGLPPSSRPNVSPLPADAAPSFSAMADKAADAGPVPQPFNGGQAPSPPAFPPSKPGKKADIKGKDKFAPMAAALLVIILFVISYMFCIMLTRYQANVSTESAAHLSELTRQIGLYVEGRIANDWNVACSVADSLSFNKTMDDETMVAMLTNRRSIWGVDDIILYTEDGFGLCTDGTVTDSGAASKIMARAIADGEYMSVLDSNITYTVPVKSSVRFRGSQVAAISIVRNMDTFIDEMGFSSFDGTAWLVLTEENGIVISRLSDGPAVPYNVLSLLDGGELTSIDGKKADPVEMLQGNAPGVYEINRPKTNDEYSVSTLVRTSHQPLRLFYFVPEQVVNKTMRGFSQYVTFISLAVTSIFALFFLSMFLYIVRRRTRQVDEALAIRERTFDLLVQNTNTAFGLFALNAQAPSYISANAEQVTGEKYILLNKDAGGYHVRGESGRDSEAMRLINQAMKEWDGVSPFKSGYVPGGQGIFELQLYFVPDAGEYVGIAQDMTQAYQREAATRSALAIAERASRAKTRFLSNMSHDIRTPMNAIVNMTDFAMESLNEPKRLAPYLQTIRESSDHLLSLINDVLDMSRIESGLTVLEEKPFDLKAELTRIVDIVRPLCAAGGLTFLTDYTAMNAVPVVGDRLKLAQVLLNLFSNAVKFTPSGGAVRFTAVPVPSLRRDIFSMRFMVEDNGMGISPAYIDHIFEPFSRGDDRRVSKVEGTGLGLSICRSYVTAMGGTIYCESEEGEGTIFTVELSFRKADALPAPVQQHISAGENPFLGLRCLVGEDNETNRVIAKTMLERLGFLVNFATDGFETAQTFITSAPGYFDIVYIDIQMPVMDGYQAAVAIRESDHPQAKRIPIVAMTANVFAEDIEKARIAGMDGHLGKPLTTMAIVEETNRALHRDNRG